MRKKYFTEEEKKAAKREYLKQWRETHPDYNKEWGKTPYGRAHYILKSYRNADKKAGRGECTLTAEWIVENIFSKPCAHCGKEGWKVVGCNRLDNSLPHTPENVEPCCRKCNSILAAKELVHDDLGKFNRKTPVK